MNHDERSLSRLLKAAAQSPRDIPATMPFPLEARILACWRSARLDDEMLLLATLCRHAMMFAAVVMVGSVGWNHFSNAREVPGEVVLAQLAKDIQIVP